MEQGRSSCTPGLRCVCFSAHFACAMTGTFGVVVSMSTVLPAVCELYDGCACLLCSQLSMQGSTWDSLARQKGAAYARRCRATQIIDTDLLTVCVPSATQTHHRVSSGTALHARRPLSCPPLKSPSLCASTSTSTASLQISPQQPSQPHSRHSSRCNSSGSGSSSSSWAQPVAAATAILQEGQQQQQGQCRPYSPRSKEAQ